MPDPGKTDLVTEFEGWVAQNFSRPSVPVKELMWKAFKAGFKLAGQLPTTFIANDEGSE